MSYVNPIWLEGQRKKWLRHDWRLWVKPEAHHLYEPLEEKRALRFDEVARRSEADAAAAREQEAFEQELLELRWLVKSVKLDLALQRFQRKYDPDQPRVPAGNSSGGQWTREGPGAEGQRPRLVSAEARAPLRPLSRPIPGHGPTGPAGVERALAEFSQISRFNNSEARGVFSFNSRAFLPDGTMGDLAPKADLLTRDQVDEACPRYSEVQSITDQSATALNRGDYESAAAYGTAVHTRIKREINGPDTTPSSAPWDPDFRAEVSRLKGQDEDARYGVRGSIRIDVFENPGTGTICVYDIKTGDSRLSFARMRELAGAAWSLYPSGQRILVTEVRPHQ